MVIFLISDLIWSFGAVSVCCELCERALYAFGSVNDEFSQLDWYLFSIKTQKTFLQIETNAQKPPQFQCFGSLTCERVVMKHVSIFIKISSLIVESRICCSNES